jgi:hypothetical protein
MKMAYNNKNEVTEVLCDIEKNSRGDVIRVSSITNGDTKSYDIRNMYTGDDGELKFTSKGIRIKTEYIVEIISSILADVDDSTYDEVIERLNNLIKSDDSIDTEDTEE